MDKKYRRDSRWKWKELLHVVELRWIFDTTKTIIWKDHHTRHHRPCDLSYLCTSRLCRVSMNYEEFSSRQTHDHPVRFVSAGRESHTRKQVSRQYLISSGTDSSSVLLVVHDEVLSCVVKEGVSVSLTVASSARRRALDQTTVVWQSLSLNYGFVRPHELVELIPELPRDGESGHDVCCHCLRDCRANYNIIKKLYKGRFCVHRHVCFEEYLDCYVDVPSDQNRQEYLLISVSQHIALVFESVIAGSCISDSISWSVDA